MKKYISLILSLPLFISPVYAATEDQEITFTQQSSTGQTTVTFTAPPTANCTMTVAGAATGDGIDMVFDSPAVFDSDGNTYSDTQSSAAGYEIAIVAAANLDAVTPPFAVTVSVGALVSYYSIISFKSFCGLANPAIDQVATAADPGPQASDATVTTASTTQANATVIAAMGMCTYPDASSSNVGITTPTTDYASIVSEQNCASYQAGDISWKNVTVQGAQSASWSHTDVTSSGGYYGWVAAIMALKDAIPGGAPAGVRRRAVIIQ